VYRFIGRRIQVVAFADVKAVLLDHVDHAGLHRGNSHLCAVDGQLDSLVRSNGVSAGEGQREQRRTDQEPKHRRARFVELIQSIQNVVYPRLSDG
jgi:hypothetical protein